MKMFLFLEQRKQGDIANKKNLLTGTLKLNVSKVKARDSVRVRDITSHQYEKVSWEEKYLEADISQFQLTQISLTSITKKKKNSRSFDRMAHVCLLEIFQSRKNSGKKYLRRVSA